MKSTLIIVVVIVLAVIAFWYFTQPQALPSITTQNVSNSSTVTNVSVQNNTVPLASSYNDSDALNNLSSQVFPIVSILSGQGFLNNSNASAILNGTISNMTAFKSNPKVLSLNDSVFFISYSNAVIELANANLDFLTYLFIQQNETSAGINCKDKQLYKNSLFFLNKSIAEVLKSSSMFNSTSNFTDLSNEMGVNYTISNLQQFSTGLQQAETISEQYLNSKCP